MKRAVSYWMGAVLAAGLVLAGLHGCSTETEDPSFRNPFDPALGAGVPVPDSVKVLVGDQVVHLTWRLPAGTQADEFAVFRKRVEPDPESSERLIGRVSVQEYADAGVRSGASYAYRLAAGVGGQFGPRTEEILATPGLYAIVLSDGNELTRQREVAVGLNASGAQAVQLSEDPADATAAWRTLANALSWVLSSGDGTKTVYARFRLPDGAESLPVFDTIRLDTRAAIESFTFDGPSVRKPGEVIHFRLVAGEPNGSASVTVTGVFNAVPLYDDGTNGDAVAADGTYERDVTLPPTAAVTAEEAVGSFTDEAGNAATVLSAPVLLTVRQAPDPVTVLVARVSEPPDAPSVSLRWTLSQEPDFAAYRVFRATTAGVDSTDELVGSLAGRTVLSFDDHDVVEGETYAYRIYVQDGYGLETGSNTVQASVENVRVPSAVTLRQPTALSTTRIALEWTRSADEDFAAYRVYRNETGAVSNIDSLIAELADVDHNFYDDNELRENTAYSFRVYTVDQGGLEARSNEVEARTENEAPVSVTLNAPANIDSTAATLSWGASDAHDFAYYRLYRDQIATVTTSSTLVVEMDDASFQSFRDTELEPGTRYYYRVFVVDDAPSAKTAGSNTVTVRTLDSKAGAP